MGLGCSLGNRARCVSLPSCFLKDAFLLPSSGSQGRTQLRGKGWAAPQLSLAPVTSRVLSQKCLLAAQGGLELGLDSGGRERGSLLLESQALRVRPGPCSSARATVERLLYASSHAGCRGGPPGFLPTPEPSNDACLLGWVADWSPRLLVLTVGRDQQRRRETAR